MTYLIKRIDISGFQRNRDIAVNLRPDVNFIIGRNGVGKTSFVRLLHSCLSFDASELAQIPFQQIQISFTDTSTGHTPAIKVDRITGARYNFRVQFREKGRQPFDTYLLGDDDQPYFRMMIEGDQRVARRFRPSEGGQDLRPISSLQRKLRENLQFSWLPLSRTRSVDPRREIYLPEHSEEPINRKLRELTSQMTSYLAVLDGRVLEQNRKFQREVFTSYFERDLFSVPAMKRLNLTNEKNQLLNLFAEMEYPTTDILTHIDGFFERTRKTQTNIKDKQDSYGITDAVNVVTSTALHRVISSFETYTKAKEKIQFPKNQFIRLLNSLLYKKEAFFNEGNVLQVRITSDSHEINPRKRQLELFDLSSGERQLMVILSETLLQQSREYIFIADEPELSLHVAWQEQLVKTIREMNANSQIIFATHSPDIVSVFQDNVIDFESL